MVLRSRWLGILVIGLTVCLVGSQVWAQPPAQPGGQRGPREERFFGPMGGAGGNLMLLMNPTIIKELELSDEQEQKLRQLNEEVREKMRQQFADLRDLSPEQRQARFQQMRETMEAQVKEVQKKVNEILLPHQQKRLEQIGFQMRTRMGGVGGVIEDPQVVKKLGLTEDQIQKLRQIREETMEKLRTLPQQIQKEAEEKAMNVLTEQQKQLLKEMRGERFDFDFGVGPGGRRQGPRAKPQPKE